MTKKHNKKPAIKGGYMENIHKPLYTLEHEELREILDCNWYPKANEVLNYQRMIWDYSYLAYKGIMTWNEINRKRRANNLGMYVNVPRTFMTIEGIRRNFNINKLRVSLNDFPGMKEPKRNAISSFVNYDLIRGGSFKQVKNAGFDKLLFGDGFLYPYLCDRQGKFGRITGDIDPETGYVKYETDKEFTRKYFGMMVKRESVYNVFPDPDGTTTDFNDSENDACQYHCIRKVKHIAKFRRDWAGIVPQELLESVEPGGLDMTNYESIRQTIDVLFSWDSIRYTGTSSDFVRESKVSTSYGTDEYVEERIWLGEDFFILQAGADMKFLIISPNQNPSKNLNLIKLSDVSMPGEYWSMGEPYILRYQQVEENRLHNAILDSVMYSITNMLGINVNYLEDPEDFEPYPGKTFKFKPMPGVKMDEVMQSFQAGGSGIAGGINFLHEVKGTGQSATAITDFVTGASKSISDSATEANKLSGASDLAIMDKVKEIAGEALTEVAKNFLSMYPVAYDDEAIEGVLEKNNIYFCGKTKEKIKEKELAKILENYDVNNIIFKDDLDISEPTFITIGDVSMDRERRLRQWTAAIDFAKSTNEVAYATGDRRRLDTIAMGQMALENFDVVGNPEKFVMDNQPIKTDEIQLNAEMNMKAGQANKMQEQNGGAPKKNKVAGPTSENTTMRNNAQPNSRGKNESTKKNK